MTDALRASGLIPDLAFAAVVLVILGFLIFDILNPPKP